MNCDTLFILHRALLYVMLGEGRKDGKEEGGDERKRVEEVNCFVVENMNLMFQRQRKQTLQVLTANSLPLPHPLSLPLPLLTFLLTFL